MALQLKREIAEALKQQRKQGNRATVLPHRAHVRVVPRRDARDLELIADMLESNRVGGPVERVQAADRLREIAQGMLVRGKNGAYTPGKLSNS